MISASVQETKGQTYLYWQANKLFQLPVSYFAPADQWANSPGLPDQPVFNRPVTSRCMECHSTFAAYTETGVKRQAEFDKGKIIYGVQCEKCHGPGAEHAVFHAQHPGETKGKYISNPGNFTRQQQVDLCALCHGGRMDKLKPSFTFVAGDSLSRFFKPNETNKLIPTLGNVEVHGNQVGLLQSSKCYTMTSTLTCLTCHNTHESERGKIELFSQRCMTCHSVEHNNFCKMNDSLGPSITSNCIDCHMPRKTSMAIALKLQGNGVPTAASIRSHLISIYSDETKKFMEAKKRTKK